MVSTRRPITPREPTRRQLYGKVSLSDRPPSAFRYLFSSVSHSVPFSHGKVFIFRMHSKQSNESKWKHDLQTDCTGTMHIEQCDDGYGCLLNT